MECQPARQLVSCPYCRRYPLEKFRGLAGHIRQSPECERKQAARLSSIHTRNHHGAPPHQRGSCDPESNPGCSDPLPQQDLDFNQDIGTSDQDLVDERCDATSNGTDSRDRVQLNPSGPWRYLARDPGTEPFVGDYAGTAWDKKKSKEDPKLTYHPWASKEEFEVVNWLSSEGLSQGAINRFLKLQYVSYDETT